MTEPASPSRADAGAIAARLREAVTVLDEPFHRETVASVLAEAADALAALVTRCDRLAQEVATYHRDLALENVRRLQAEAALAETQARLSVASEAAHRLAGHLTHDDPYILDRAEWETCEEDACIKDRAALALAARVGATPQEAE